LRHARVGGVCDGVLALCDDATDDVPIGDDADGLIVDVDDRNLTAVVQHHHPGDLIERGIRGAARRIRGHDVPRYFRHLSLLSKR
jgi:hypothetical protein